MEESKFKTPNGKPIQVVKKPRDLLYSISFSNGGQLPESLSGKFTTPQLAEKAIIAYLENLNAQKQSKQAV